ncbi:alpha-ketoglutarate-dependent dioxygenase AlkB [Kangiella sp. TOML190]|uniref:alpha-ketoglutarate-dependent dioxygenase AlkB family protein n=1 Tax=Kangiella sp. TOML190 TaxID=2931351 RepID=UPI00203BFB70|nr:alpha-ketoglutarate-dependent dioxygenase AlkB [Kangiella sp. TOML190]
MLQFDLLAADSVEEISLPDAQLLFWPEFLSPSNELAETADAFFQRLYGRIQWQQETIRIAGVDRLVPRLTAWYGDPQARYRYSGVEHAPLAWIPELLQVKSLLEQQTGETFNSVLANLYRDGQDSVAWHSDDEPELGKNPVIASVSLGATRSFQLKRKTKPKLSHKIALTSGSLLLMKGKTQSHWLHQVPKERAVLEPRINLTFRKIITT